MGFEMRQTVMVTRAAQPIAVRKHVETDRGLEQDIPFKDTPQ